ncbi:hypothetical protein J6590_035424 [Homalodisca vitripennis]|nr:hypothetical protein J6590_035424 [Homalodisca vitripennis]
MVPVLLVKYVQQSEKTLIQGRWCTIDRRQGSGRINTCQDMTNQQSSVSQSQHVLTGLKDVKLQEDDIPVVANSPSIADPLSSFVTLTDSAATGVK